MLLDKQFQSLLDKIRSLEEEVLLLTEANLRLRPYKDLENLPFGDKPE